MEHLKIVPDGNEQMEISQTPIMCGLPDDISLSCLARVPRKYHMVLKCVSKRWRDLVCSEEWYSYRQKHKLHETWIYALCRDKSDQICCYVLDPDSPRRRWKLIQGPPSSSLKRKGMGFQVLGRKLYLLGGCGWLEDATDEVFCYDASMNVWSQATPLSTARCYFSCEVLDEKIYAIGGLGLSSSDTHSWDTYETRSNRWIPQSDTNIIPEIEDSVVMDGKIYIHCGTSAVSSHVYAVVYEPSSGIWQHTDADMVRGWQGPAVVVDGILYVLDQKSGTKLMMWRKDIREWIPVGRLSPLLTRPPCQIVAIGNRVFVIGKRLSTVVFYLDHARDIEGVMLSSSIPESIHVNEVISCKALAL